MSGENTLQENDNQYVQLLSVGQSIRFQINRFAVETIEQFEIQFQYI